MMTHMSILFSDTYYVMIDNNVIESYYVILFMSHIRDGKCFYLALHVVFAYMSH